MAERSVLRPLPRKSRERQRFKRAESEAASQRPIPIMADAWLMNPEMDRVLHSPGLLILLFGISLLLIGQIYWLFGLCQDRPGRASWVRKLEVDPAAIGGFSYSRLALVSLLSLFLEMLMIRWVSSEIRVFAYFKNLVLVACFLGFGLGCYLCRRPVQLLLMLGPLLTLTVILKTPASPLRQIVIALPQMLGGGTEVQIWGVPSLPTSWPGTLLALVILVPLFAVIAIAFVPTGQLVGWYLEKAPNGVTAYSVNVLASLAGIAFYTLLCFLYQPPAAWVMAAGALCVLLFWRQPRPRWALMGVFLCCSLLLTLRDHRQTRTYWSPYQKLDLRPNYENGRVASFTLNTNDSWYQQIVDLSPGFVQSRPDEFREHPAEWRAYNLPYRFFSAPPSVLILGAGMGNDVAAALRNGAGRVVAVEIDPLIVKLGRELHFERPYQSPKTQVVINDARSYIQNSRERFDLIVFSLLDSHTTSSHFSNIRIDNFVYTREALERARQLLKPDGLFVVKFQVGTPWIAGRLAGLLKTVFAQDPIQFQSDPGHYDTAGRFFVVGSQQRIEQAMFDPVLAAFVRTHAGMPTESAPLTTDDWPYFYQHEPGLPISVILVSLAVLLTFGWFLRQISRTEGSLDFHFLLLGAGFMLLEALIVSRMALLFGTTWVVNSIVVASILCLIVAANFVYQRFPAMPLSFAYVALFASLAVSFLVPTDRLSFGSLPVRVMVSTPLLSLPVFFAGIIFVSSFARANFQGTALGSNLFGSLAGGLLESLALWFGLKWLIVLAALLYGGSALALLRRTRSPELISTVAA
jgi:spermidine synthase